MSVHDRRIWNLIYPTFLGEDNLFGDVDELAANVAKANATEIPNPNCHHCYGKGVKGSIIRAKRTTGRINPDGTQQPAPITYEDLKKNNVRRAPIFCQCINKTFAAIKELAKEYDEFIRPTESS